METHNRPLQEALDGLARRTALLRQREDAQVAVDAAQDACEITDAVLQVAQHALAVLEGFSLHSLWLGMLGQRNERLNTARKEQRSAARDAARQHEALIEAEARLAELDTQLRGLSGLDSAYQQALGARERRLLSEPALESELRAKRLRELKAEAQTAEAESREVREAIKSGELALGAARAVERILKSAANWGTLDMLGGGLLSTAAKHSRLDDAARASQTLQRQLKAFRREIADTSDDVHGFVVSLDGFDRAADFWFDNLFTDLRVQQHIRTAQANLQHLIGQLNAAQATLRQRVAALEARRASLERSREALLIEDLSPDALPADAPATSEA